MMENEFRTTFIPKTPIAQQSSQTSAPVSKPVGILFVISLIIFIVSVAVAGGMYGYKTYLNSEVAKLAVSLESVQKSLDPNTIKQFTVMDKRLRNSETLLNQHIVTLPLFTMLGVTTLPTVRYTKMDMSFNEAGNLSVAMSGESDGYRSIALQSQALSQNANLSDTIFSNFTVTPKGRVSFDVAFTIPKGDLLFAKNLESSPVQSAGDTSSEELLPNDTEALPDVTIDETEIQPVVPVR